MKLFKSKSQSIFSYRNVSFFTFFIISTCALYTINTLSMFKAFAQKVSATQIGTVCTKRPLFASVAALSAGSTAYGYYKYKKTDLNSLGIYATPLLGKPFISPADALISPEVTEAEKRINTVSELDKEKNAPSDIAQRYIAFSSHFFGSTQQHGFDNEQQALFAPAVKKTINSSLICKGRKQCLEHLRHLKKTYGTPQMHVLETLQSTNPNKHVIHSETLWPNDKYRGVGITILTTNTQGLIEEIDMVTSEKCSYKWQQ